MQNNEVVYNAIKTSNRNSRELLIRNSTRFVNKLNAHNLKWRRLYNLSTITKYHKHVWLNSEESSSAYFAHERDLKEACEISMCLYNRLYYNSCALKHQDRQKCNSIWSVTRLISLIYFISLLHNKAAEDMQQ